MTFALPQKSLFYLVVIASAMAVAYVVCMAMALYFASSATELSGMARAKEADVVALETEYYAAITELTKTDPSHLGYVIPSRVVYVDTTGAPALSRAGR